MKRKKVLWVLLLLVCAVPALLYYQLQKTDAPLLKGKVDLCITYKQDLLLDIYEPTKEVYDKHPVLIYVHGGAWIGGAKVTVNNDRFHGAFNTLREQGYAIVSPDYTLARYGKSPFPDCVSDVFEALAWIEKNASTYNFDLNNIGMIGESAGGHLALMAAYANAEQFTKANSLDLNYVIGIYPPTDLQKLYVDQQGLIQEIKASVANLPDFVKKMTDVKQYLFPFDPEKDPERTKAFTGVHSPINYLKDKVPATLLVHGDADRVVPVSQSKVLIAEMEKRNIPVEYHEPAGVDHAFRGASPEQKAQTQKWIIDFVRKEYR